MILILQGHHDFVWKNRLQPKGYSFVALYDNRFNSLMPAHALSAMTNSFLSFGMNLVILLVPSSMSSINL